MCTLCSSRLEMHSNIYVYVMYCGPYCTLYLCGLDIWEIMNVCSKTIADNCLFVTHYNYMCLEKNWRWMSYCVS